MNHNEDPRWSNDIDFCINQLENEIPSSEKRSIIPFAGLFNIPNDIDKLLQKDVLVYKNYKKVTICDNPSHEETLKNLYKIKYIKEELK